MTRVAREQCRSEKERREESGRKLKDIYSILTNKERAIDRLEKQLSKCQLDLTELTQEANQKCLDLQRQISDRDELLAPATQLMQPEPKEAKASEQLIGAREQLIGAREERVRLLERMETQERQLLELKEQLTERTCSEEQMHLKVKNTVGKLELVQREKMELEQLLHETIPSGGDKRGSRRSKKIQRQSMHAMISEINRMSDSHLVQASLPISHLRTHIEFPRGAELRARSQLYSPEHTPSSSRKGSPSELEMGATKQSPTESDLGANAGHNPGLRGSHSSLSDIDTMTTISDTSHIVDESITERTEFDPGAPKLSIPRSRRKTSLKRKSSLRRIVHSFRVPRPPNPRDLPAPVMLLEEPESRRSRLEIAISAVERQNTQFLLWAPEALQAWVEVELGLPETVGDSVRWQCKTVPMLLSMGDRDYEQELGIQEPLLRLKLMKAVQERVALSKASMPCLYSPYRGVHHDWIASQWLPSLGLTQYNNNFR